MTLIDSFLTNYYCIERRAMGTYSGGIYCPGPKEIFTVFGSMQPTTARALKIQEEGDRISQYYVFYTDKPIMTSDPESLAKSDRIIINGESFKVMGVTHWEGVRLPYYKSILAREPQ